MISEPVRGEMIRIVESYSEKYVEQPLAILAFYLHPETVEHARKLPRDTELTSFRDLPDTAVKYFKRFFPNTSTGRLRGDFLELVYRRLMYVMTVFSCFP